MNIVDKQRTTFVPVDDLLPGMQARGRDGTWLEIEEIDRWHQTGGCRWRAKGRPAFERFVPVGSHVEVLAEDYEF